MSLKRKRSSSELPSSPLSFASSFSSPPNNGPSMFDFTPRMGLINPCHLNSRTLKRFRDNRPSQEEIHREYPISSIPAQAMCLVRRVLTKRRTERTLELLFNAQQQQQHQDPASPCPVIEAPPEAEQPAPNHSNNQQSLHRFWNIRSQPTAAPDTTIEPMNMGQS